MEVINVPKVMAAMLGAMGEKERYASWSVYWPDRVYAEVMWVPWKELFGRFREIHWVVDVTKNTTWLLSFHPTKLSLEMAVSDDVNWQVSDWVAFVNLLEDPPNEFEIRFKHSPLPTTTPMADLKRYLERFPVCGRTFLPGYATAFSASAFDERWRPLVNAVPAGVEVQIYEDEVTISTLKRSFFVYHADPAARYDEETNPEPSICINSLVQYIPPEADVIVLGNLYVKEMPMRVRSLQVRAKGMGHPNQTQWLWPLYVTAESIDVCMFAPSVTEVTNIEATQAYKRLHSLANVSFRVVVTTSDLYRPVSLATYLQSKVPKLLISKMSRKRRSGEKSFSAQDLTSRTS